MCGYWESYQSQMGYEHGQTARWCLPPMGGLDFSPMVSIQALPPDRRYRATVVEYVEDGDLEDSEFLQRLRDGAVSFSLDAGATERLSLTLPPR